MLNFEQSEICVKLCFILSKMKDKFDSQKDYWCMAQ